jgi:hypothetical protein
MPHVRVVKTISRVFDWPLLFQQVGNDCQVQDAMIRAAEYRLKKGQAVDGVAVEEKQR